MTRARTGIARNTGSRRFGVGLTRMLAAVFVVGAALSGAGPAAADPADPDLEANLTVDVTDGIVPTSAPTPASPPTLPPRSSGTGTVTGSGVATQATIPNQTAADDALDDAVVVSGTLAMSGLTASASPSILVGNGTLTVDFVVRNLSSSTFDSTASFWVDNAVGGRIAELDDIEIDGLEPDETRRVQVRFEGLGQHIVLHANATLNPPDMVEGVALEPISRNTTVMVPPWFSVSLVSVIGLLGWLSWWLVRRGARGARFMRIGA